MTAVVQIATGAFQADASGVDGSTIIIVAVPRNPDRRREKWDGAQIVAKTAQEITAYDDAVKDVQATGPDRDLLIQAVAQLDYEERQKLTVKAGQTLLTPAQCKARIKAIYRALLP